MKIFSILPWADWLALVCFFSLWIGYATVAKPWARRRPSLLATTNRYRRYWMEQAIDRDPRMLDGLITQNLSSTPSFFSSTSILIIGGLFALLGTTDKATELLRRRRDQAGWVSWKLARCISLAWSFSRLGCGVRQSMSGKRKSR